MPIRYYNLDFLKVLAAIFITNSHFIPLYKDISPSLATFGVHGNALFFFVSGFVLMMGFEKKKDLDEYLEYLEDAKQRDHRKIGKELGIFMISQNVGAGLPFWLPKGATIRRVVERYIVDKEIECGYEHVPCKC